MSKNQTMIMGYKAPQTADNYLLSIILDNQSRFNEQKIGTLELDEGT